jgi:hypothetical protein
MADRVSGVVPNLVNGISQQAAALRLPSQAELQENYYSTIVEGLKDRPPTEFVAKLLDSLPAGVFSHIINRDVNERYIVVYDGTAVRVWDFAGNEKTVATPDGYGYLSGIGTPATDMLALTVADYTFIVNRMKAVAAGTATAPSRNPEALINVLAGNYGKSYTIKINGAVVAEVLTPMGGAATDAPGVDTVNIAQMLLDGTLAGEPGTMTSPPDGTEGKVIGGGGKVVKTLDAQGINAAGGWTVGRYGNALHISKDDGTDFTIEVEDGYNGNAMKAVKGKTQHFSDLPNYAPNGFVAEIVGDQTNVADDYWVKAENDGDAASPITWKETMKPGITLGLDASTMPYTLVRESDGTFTFGKQTWQDRKCGDTESSPDPSFVGQTINDVFFTHDRLGFLANQNAILSRTGKFFDFYRTSVTALLDDDPIDAGASHTKVSILQHAVPYQKQLLMFSDQTQFLFSGQPTSLTPRNDSLDPLTEYVSDTAVKPLGLGLSVFFAAKRGDWSAVWEYVIDTASGEPIGDASEVTDDAPHYIPAGLFRLAGTSNESIVAGLTTGDPSALYIYKFHYQERKKVQSSWSRFPLEGVNAILNAEFIDSDLYLVVERNDGVFLEKLRMSPAVTDTDLGFLVHLDQRIHTSQLAAPVYDAVAKTTTYTLPYMADRGDLVAVTSSGNEDVLPALELGVTVNNYTVTLQGDTTAYPIWFGYLYERRYRFSTFFVLKPNGAGGTITVQKGRLQIIDLSIGYSNTAMFTVEVTPKGRAKRTYTFTGRLAGDPDNLLGVVPVKSGQKTIPVLSRNDRVTIDIVTNSWMPSAFINAIWTGKHNPKSKDY